MTPPITRRCLECGDLFIYTPIINFGKEYFPRVRCDKCDLAAAAKQKERTAGLLEQNG